MFSDSTHLNHMNIIRFILNIGLNFNIKIYVSSSGVKNGLFRLHSIGQLSDPK